MISIAIVGNIASGKSTVENVLRKKGYKVFDSDIIAHEVLDDLSEKILEAFKDYDILENGRISRQKLGALVFDDKNLKEKLENIVHPEIKDRLKKIFEENKLVGIFSENTLLDIVRLETGILIDEKTNFSSIKESLKIDNHSMESFEFISRRKNIYDVEDLFKNYFSSHKRVGCVYITENGRKEENILGMLTAWDVLGN